MFRSFSKTVQCKQLINIIISEMGSDRSRSKTRETSGFPDELLHYTTVAADSLLEQECSKLEHGMINIPQIEIV